MSGLFDDIPYEKKKSTITSGLFDDIPVEQDNAFMRGVNRTKQAISLTGNLSIGDMAGAAQNIREAHEYSLRNPGNKEANELMTAFGQGDGFWGGLSGMGGEVAKDWSEAQGIGKKIGSITDNIVGAGSLLVEQVPNMIAPMAGMGAGAVGGAAAGSAVPVVGTVAGGVVGGVLGAGAGNTSQEIGFMAREAVQEAGIDPEDMEAVQNYLEENRGSFIKQGATKGMILGAVDRLSMGIAGRLLRGPADAATKRALTSMGVDISDKAATKAAMTSSEFAGLIAVDATYQASRAGAGQIARNAAAFAVDPAGEFTGEFLSTGLATGEWDTKEAGLEALMGLGQSSLMYGGQKAYQAATSPVRRKVQPLATEDNPAPAPVEAPDPDNGPLSKAASKMPEPLALPAPETLALPSPEQVFYAGSDGAVNDIGPVVSVDGETQPAFQGRTWINPENNPEVASYGPGMDLQAPAPGEGKRSRIAGRTVENVETPQAQRPQPEERNPEGDAAAAWDSMNAFERGAAAKGNIDSVSSVVGKRWAALTDEQRTRLIGAVNEQQGSRWTDPNRRATNQSGPVLQPRDRSQQASISQMLNIAKAPDYAKTSYSRTFTDGAPVTIDELPNLPAAQRGRQESVTTASDRKIPVQYAVVEAGQLLPSNNISGASNAEYSTGGQGKSRAIAGNGRVAGLTEAWKRGTADQYKADMMADDAHGISPEVIQAMKRPVLVRLMPQSEVTDDIGDLSNRDGKLDTGVVEQAKEDGRSIDLASLAYDAEGGIGGDTVKDFVSRLPGASNLVSNGKVTQEARDRLAAAVFQKAYNNDALTELLTERGEGARSVINAMALAAPHMTRLEGAGVFDIRDLVAQAGEIALTAAREGRSLQSHIQQLDMGVDPHVYPILEMMVNDKGGIRSAKYIAEQLVNLANLAHYEASQTGTDMFGERPARSTEQLISDAFEGVTGNVQQAEQATADSEQSGSEEDLGQPGRPEPADQVDEGREGGRERPEDAGRTAQAEQPTEVEQARPVEIQRTEDGKSIRVYGDRAEVRSQLRAAGIRLPGAEIDGGLSFAARLEAQIRDVLGVQEQAEEELTGQADDVLVDDGQELEPATQDDRATTGKAFVEKLLRKAEPVVEVTNLGGKRVEITTRTMKAGIFKSERDTLTKIGDNGGRNFDHQEITDDGNRDETWSVRRTGKYQGDQGVTAMHQVIRVLGEATPEQNTKWRSNYMQAMKKARDIGLDTDPLKGQGLKALVDAIDAHEQGQDFNLQTQTEEELAQQEADRKAQAEAEAKQKAQEEAEAKRKKDEQNTKARADEVVDDFQLGQSSDEAMSGMGDMFSQPEQQEVGAFGLIFRQFRHDARGAIEHLRKQQTGEAIAALHHPDVGDIDLVWGKEGTAAREYEDGMGLAKIIKKHSEVLDDLQGFVGGLSVQKRSKNRVVLSDGSGKALVRLDWDGESKHWLLTAYDDSRKAPVTGEGRTGVSAGAESAPPADQGTEAEPSIPQAETAIIEDFGEKMSGTRKEQAQSMVSRVDAMSDDDIAASPLSKIWPKNEVDKIEDTFQAAAHHVIRSAIPSKPRDKYRLKAWVERVKAAKELSKEFAELGEGVTTAEMRKRMTLGPIADHIELLTNIDRKHWGRIDSVGIYQGRYQKDGEMVPGSWVQVKMDSRTRLFYGHDSVTSALQEIKNTIESSEPKQSKMKFAVYSHRSTGKAFISYDGDKEKRKLKEFDSVKEAHSYVSSNHDDLLAAWEAVKLRDNVTRKDVRQAANSQRVGPDYRNGKDVTPEAFLKAFGFRGVDFGKWVSQGRGGKERQGLLNDAHDALMDLASVLNLPPRALSLNGELGVGFGSRGRGGRAAAHYEPGNVVINLTKTQGAGSLAHEWFHALDHYFARQRTAPVDSKDWQSGYITFRPEPLYVVNPEKNPQRWSLQLTQAELKRRHKQSSESGFYDPDNWMPDPNHPEGVRPVVERAFAAVVEALDDSPMAKRARMIDQGASDGYWSRIIERGARGFETYVIAKLADTGARNDYLANVVSFERFARNPDRYPYLTTDEQGPVNEAFDALFGTIETRDGEDGNVVLFSFAGQKSGTAMHAELAKAKRLAARGVGNEDVRQATGWHRGTDGKWRYEISDHEAKLAVSGSTMGEVVDLATMNALADGRSEATIGDVMDHPALFRAYPELAKIKVRKMDGPSRTAIASVRAVGNTFTISLNPRAKGNYALSALIHELQHAIQTIEGFARGGNSRMAARLSNLSLSDKAAANAYMRLYGEVEARNTQARMQMNEEFRKLFPPSETQDVSDADAIVTFNGSEVQDFAAADALTGAQLRNVFAARFPKLVKALDGMLAKGDKRESGGLIILNTADPLKIAGQFSKATGRNLNESIRLFSNAEDAQGFFDPRSGLTFLVGPSVNETNAAAVVLHEAIHGQQNKRLDQAAVQMLVNRKQEKNADTRAFLDRVVRRMAQAEGGVTEPEAAAYIVEQAIMEGRGGTGKQAIDSGFYSWLERNLGQAVADLVRGFVRAYRQFALRNGLDARLTIDDMIQYAQASMRQSAKAGAVTTGAPAVRRSTSGQGAEDAARAEGRRQFEETERAYGGRAAYDKAKAAGKTKLNYQQWVQVRTPAFKEWFGDWEYGNDQRRAGVLGAVQERSNTSGSGKGTAGVDTRTTGPAGREWRLDQDTGEPRVFYHGTKDEFTTFDLNHPNRKDSGWLGRGVYTASDQRLADMSAINKRGNSKRKVMPLFVNVRNPAVGSLDIKQKLRNASQEYIDEVTQSMRDRGYDGAVMELPDGTLELMAMNPADVKSATDNVGTFSADTNDIRFSRKAAQKAVDSLMGWAGKVDTHTNRKRAMPKGLSQEQQAAAGKFDTFTARTPLADVIQKVAGWNGKRFHQKVFDQFATIGDYSHKAFMQAHLSKGSETTVETVVKHGTPYLKDGAIAIDTSKGGFLAALQKHLGSADEANRFFMYVAGKRSEELANEYTVFVNDKAVKTLKSQQEADRHASQLQAGGAGKVKVKHTSRENLFSSDDIAALTKLNAGKLDNGKSRPMAYAAMHQELLRYQKAMLDMAEKAGIVNADSRKDWESEFYVPFYRVMENEDGSVNHHLGASDTGMMRQEVIKRLKGGSENLGDPINNLIANWEQLLSSSMKNMAANEALRQAEQIGAARSIPAEEWAQYKRQHGKEADGTLWTLDNGQRVYWEVADKDLLESLTALNFQGYNNGLMRAAGAFKRLLTMGVTISPTFRIRSATRDILHALAVADVGYNPARNAIEGWKQTGKDSEMMVQMLAGGGAIRFGSFTDGKSGDMTRKMIEQGIKGDQILNTPEKFKRFFGKAFTGYMELGDRLENNSRVAAYQRAMEKTGDHLVASFEARDIMNFTSMGSSAAVRALAQVLPFFNARLQGMSKLYRGAKNDPRRFWGVVGTIGAASALLYLLNADDDEYKALPNHVRDTYWPVKVGGKWVYIPKPFEVGSMASVIERFTELAVAGDDYQARDFRDTIFSILVNQLEMNPVPQIILPAAESWYNYDMFRGQAIDSMAMERLMPGDRYDANTSAGAVAVGRMLNVSPKKLEHMVNGYFGWLGLQALNISDLLGRSMMDLPASTKRDMSQTNNWFIVGDFVKEPGSGASKYSARFYDVQRDINQIYATANYARSVGDLERYQELLSDPKMTARPMFQGATKRINQINQQIRATIADRNLTAAEKTERLKTLYQVREGIARQVDERARAKG